MSGVWDRKDCEPGFLGVNREGVGESRPLGLRGEGLGAWTPRSEEEGRGLDSWPLVPRPQASFARMPVPGQVLERERPVSLLAPPLITMATGGNKRRPEFIPFPGHAWPPLRSLSFHDFMLLALVASSPCSRRPAVERCGSRRLISPEDPGGLAHSPRPRASQARPSLALTWCPGSCKGFCLLALGSLPPSERTLTALGAGTVPVDAP